MGAAASQVYYEDTGQVGESSPKEQIARKAEVLRTLLKRSRERSISIHWIRGSDVSPISPRAGRAICRLFFQNSRRMGSWIVYCGWPVTSRRKPMRGGNPRRADLWLARLLGPWFLSFAGLLLFLYLLLIGVEIEGRSMFQLLF